jgi:iron complex transport system substrate-binding protein
MIYFALWRTVFLFKADLKKKSVIIAAAIIASIFLVNIDPCKAANPPKKIRDAGGILHKPALYKRIVSLSPNLTEICIKLGLQKRLAGASIFGDYPEIKNVKRIDSWNINYETVLLLKPDLVLTTSSGNSPQTIERLRELKLNVFHTQQSDLDGIYRTIFNIGNLTETGKEAETLVSGMKKDLQILRACLPKKAKNPRILYLLWTSPVMATGGKTFLSEMISLAGGKNIFDGSSVNIVKPSMEKIIELDPEIIFLPADTHRSDLDKRWDSTTACKTGRVYNINEDYVLRPGVNTIKGIKALADCINPPQRQKRGSK